MMNAEAKTIDPKITNLFMELEGAVNNTIRLISCLPGCGNILEKSVEKENEAVAEIQETETIEKQFPVQVPVREFTDEEKIAMQERKICPVEVIPSTVFNKPVEKEVPKKEDASLDKLSSDLTNMGVVFNSIKRVKTGLAEVELVQLNGNIVPISVDTDGVIFGDDVRIFIMGKISPLMEYNNPLFIFAPEAISALVSGMQIDPKYCVPIPMCVLNQVVDCTTLKEKDSKKRSAILEATAKAVESMHDEIMKLTNGRPYRFAYDKCKSEKDFSLIFSKKNRGSNLSNQTLKTDIEITLTVKDGKATLKTGANK